VRGKFENNARVIGTVVSVEYRTEGLRTPFGKIKLDANGNLVTAMMWEKPSGIVKKTLNGIVEGDKYEIKGELEENLYNGEYSRQVNNKIIGKDKVYNLEKVSELSEEKAITNFNCDIVEKNISLTDTVRGEKVNQKQTKAEVVVAILNRFNSETRKKDLDIKQALIQEIEGYIKYKSNDVSQKVLLLKKEVENTDAENLKQLYSLAEKIQGIKNKLYKITFLHIVAYGDKAEEIDEKVNLYDNIVLGCSINTRKIVNEYDIVQGNLNEVEIKYVGKVNAKYKPIEDEDLEGIDLNEGITLDDTEEDEFDASDFADIY
jgi:hypothetical protein